MEKMIAYCGILCSECEAFTATQKNDMELKKVLAEKWSKEFQMEIKPEDINCCGCLSKEGAHISYCNECGIRKCAMEKGHQNCAFCDDFGCEMLNKFWEMCPSAKTTLQQIREKI